MLEWFVSPAEVNRALAGELIREDMVETMSEKIPNCCIDENGERLSCQKILHY